MNGDCRANRLDDDKWRGPVSHVENLDMRTVDVGFSVVVARLDPVRK